MDDDLKPRCTWYGGELVVEDRKITLLLDAALSDRYAYPAAAFTTVHLPEVARLTPNWAADATTLHAIRTALPGIALFHDTLDVAGCGGWAEAIARHSLCFVTVVERHGKSPGNVAHGVLKDFGLERGAVASSVGHDSHNIIVAGTNEADMRLAIDAIGEAQGGVCVVADGVVQAMVRLPIAGLLSDKRVTEVAEEMQAVKCAWSAAGCTIPYMGFNLIPLAVIPEIRLTDKGLVLVPEMELVPLFG